MLKHCPFCGELVKSDAISCPKCYKSIPTSVGHFIRIKNHGGTEGKRRYNKGVAIMLNLIFGLFGFLGFGQIYRDYRRPGGYVLFVLGLMLFGATTLMVLDTGNVTIGSIFIRLYMFPFMLLYAFLYVGSIIDILFESSIHLSLRY